MFEGFGAQVQGANITSLRRECLTHTSGPMVSTPSRPRLSLAEAGAFATQREQTGGWQRVFWATKFAQRMLEERQSPLHKLASMLKHGQPSS